MAANSCDIAGIATACPEIGFVGVKRLFHGQRLRGAGTALASTEGARSLLRLPIIKNGRAIGIVKIISVADRLRPIRALAIGDARHPRSGRAVAAIAQPYAGRDLFEN